MWNGITGYTDYSLDIERCSRALSLTVLSLVFTILILIFSFSVCLFVRWCWFDHSFVCLAVCSSMWLVLLRSNVFVLRFAYYHFLFVHPLVNWYILWNVFPGNVCAATFPAIRPLNVVILFFVESCIRWKFRQFDCIHFRCCSLCFARWSFQFTEMWYWVESTNKQNFPFVK